MMKSILAGCSLVVALAVTSLPVQAQNSSQPAPPAKPAPVTPAPSANPAPVNPSTTQAAVSPEELKKFATATKQLLAIFNDTESQMVQVVQKQGLTDTRFNEIYKSKQNPSVQPPTQITPKEEASYNQAVAQLSQIQKEARTKIEQAVQAQGIPMERFNQIFAAVQNDPQLKQEVQKMIKN